MTSECKSLDISRIKSILEKERQEREKFSSSTSKDTLRKAAILIPFVCVDGCWSLYLPGEQIH